MKRSSIHERNSIKRESGTFQRSGQIQSPFFPSSSSKCPLENELHIPETDSPSPTKSECLPSETTSITPTDTTSTIPLESDCESHLSQPHSPLMRYLSARSVSSKQKIERLIALRNKRSHCDDEEAEEKPLPCLVVNVLETLPFSGNGCLSPKSASTSTGPSVIRLELVTPFGCRRKELEILSTQPMRMLAKAIVRLYELPDSTPVMFTDSFDASWVPDEREPIDFNASLATLAPNQRMKTFGVIFNPLTHQSAPYSA